MMSVALVLCTMNNPKGVDKLLSKIGDFFDEIVIVDSSNKRNLKLLEKFIKKYKNTRIINLPPLGFVDPYLQLAINSVKSDYILLLADDEMPSEKLLKDLRVLISAGYNVYKILRLTRPYNIKSYNIRLFPKNLVLAPGLIHFGEIVSKKQPIQLNENEYYILHIDRNIGKININKLKKYALIDAYQAGMKLLWIINNYNTYYRYTENKLAYYILRIIFSIKNKLIFLDYIIWLLTATFYYLYFLLQHVLKKRLNGIIYYTLVLEKIVKNIRVVLKCWRYAEKYNLYYFIILPEDIPYLSTLSYNKTDENFVKIIYKKLKLNH